MKIGGRRAPTKDLLGEPLSRVTQRTAEAADSRVGKGTAEEPALEQDGVMLARLPAVRSWRLLCQQQRKSE